MGQVWAGVIVVCLIAAPARAAGSAADDARHVRGTGRLANTVIALAIEHSPTVADLIGQLDRSDVFVYVNVAPLDLPNAKTGLLASPGPYRYLLVSININRSPGQQVVLLGHELQHALEIAEAPDVRDGRTMAALFRRIGWSSGATNQFETHLAQAIGDRVRRDLGARVSAF